MNGFGFVWVWFKQIFFFQILNFIFCHVIIPKLIFLFLNFFFCTNQTLKITFKNIITKHLWKYFQLKIISNKLSLNYLFIFLCTKWGIFHFHISFCISSHPPPTPSKFKQNRDAASVHGFEKWKSLWCSFGPLSLLTCAQFRGQLGTLFHFIIWIIN